MKNLLKSIRFVLATLALVIISQVNLLAEGNSTQTGSNDLSIAQVVGGFAVLLFVILLPLVKSQRKVTAK